MDDGLGDWRHRVAVRLTKDVPAAFPGGPSHKAGAAVHTSTMTRAKNGQFVGFTLPSQTALALSIAIQAAKKADILKEELTYQDLTTPLGSAIGVSGERAASVYDFFEQCMIAVTFSFNALELFCNQTIADKLEGTYSRTSGKKSKSFTKDEAQRRLSTDEKLSAVLPSILAVETPRETSAWSEFRRLKRARDRTVHMKPSEAYPLFDRPSVDNQSVFSEFFSMSSLLGYPIFAIEVITYFNKPGEDERRWLRHARELAGVLKGAKRPRS